MPPDRDAGAIRDMMNAMREADRHIRGLSMEASGAASHPRDAALYRVLVLGEAATRVSSDLKDKYPHIPWADIIGMRNILIHGYEKVNWRVVWHTIHDDFPVLQNQLQPILDQLGTEHQP